MNLLVRLRHAVVQAPPTSAELGLPAELPTEALDEPGRKRFFNKRRERDPLGEGFACTWRTRLIKVAAEVITRARRVVVRLSGSWPHLDHFLQVSRAVSGPPVPVPLGVDAPHLVPPAHADTNADVTAPGRGKVRPQRPAALPGVFTYEGMNGERHGANNPG